MTAQLFVYCRTHAVEQELEYWNDDVSLDDIVKDTPQHCAGWAGGECHWLLTWKTR